MPRELLTLEEVQRRYVSAVVKVCLGNVTAAAKALGIDRKTIQRQRKRGCTKLVRDKLGRAVGPDAK